ncbi:MAG TPA: 6,7-dimethyl-8-ribityllumazine synthase, partial [Acidimicrobiales bacterium]|nr:6,7-dimethyl-8-ribityllumazine synthase [Acidimicrobiales bacterium]
MKSKGLHIAIVIGRFNEEISMRLLDGARSRLEDLGVAVADITVF